MCTQYLHYIHPPTPFHHLLYFPTGANPPGMTYSTLLFFNLSFEGKWMGLENIILSEVSQAHKAKCFLSYVE
jgi:hypothetical protein